MSKFDVDPYVGQRITEIFLENALYCYDFDLESGIIERDIIDCEGYNYTKELGLTSPCSFDALLERSYDVSYFGAWHVNGSRVNMLNHKLLLDAYRNGERMVDASIYLPKMDRYYQIRYFMVDYPGNRPHVYVSCVETTDNEKNRKRVFGELHRQKMEIDEIVSCAQMGIWHIYLFDGEKPRMTASDQMLKLLGLNDPYFPEEDLYEYWFSRVKKSALPSVYESVEKMKAEGFAENTYTWKHPERGDIIVRCGGSSRYIPEKGYVLRGYHSDVTEIVNFEVKQKQLLAEALDEVKRQKRLLQETLDNYKEADYDRRRDFLTGLRNRQDLYDLLQDVLSAKHENIQSMYMMDIDNFKKLNDLYGHVYGDECLKRIGEALNEYGKNNNMYFYRYGGEEVLAICFDERDPGRVASELVRLVVDLKIRRDDMALGVVTISLGYTADNNSYDQMIDRADKAMYKAKENGKNRAVCYENMD